MDKNLWDYTLEELVNGCAETDTHFVCPFCGDTFEKGRVLRMGEEWYDAQGALRRHVREEHGTPADFLLKQERALNGLKPAYRDLLLQISAGANDKEISAALGTVQSTLRSQRFALREKERQARIFLAIMESLRRNGQTIGNSDFGRLEEIHAGAAMVDERYVITEQETDKALKTYMDENGAIRQFPAREKKKIILMREVMKNFKHDTDYTEREVNRILKRIYEADYPGLRRALIEYGFMERSADCSVYRVKE